MDAGAASASNYLLSDNHSGVSAGVLTSNNSKGADENQFRRDSRMRFRSQTEIHEIPNAEHVGSELRDGKIQIDLPSIVYNVCYGLLELKPYERWSGMIIIVNSHPYR